MIIEYAAKYHTELRPPIFTDTILTLPSSIIMNCHAQYLTGSFYCTRPKQHTGAHEAGFAHGQCSHFWYSGSDQL